MVSQKQKKEQLAKLMKQMAGEDDLNTSLSVSKPVKAKGRGVKVPVEKIIETAPEGYVLRKKHKSVPWYSPTEQFRREVKQLAFDEDTTISKLITQGLIKVLEEKGKNVQSLLEK